jgi:hypothetical protein
VVNVEFNLVQVQAAQTESPTLLPECGIAALGAGLLELPFLQLTGINYEITPASALDGGVAAILAVVAGYGVSRWECWAQIVIGFAIAFAPFFLRPYSGGKVDMVALFVGLLIALLAGIEVECWKDAARRSPSGLACALTRPRPRLVYFSAEHSYDDGTRTPPNDRGADHVARS